MNGQFYATTGKKNIFASQKSKKKNKFPCNLYIDLPCKLAVDLKIFVFKILCCGTCEGCLGIIIKTFEWSQIEDIIV